jgi:hypothetical protein
MSIEEELLQINRNEGLQEWMEQLPFPLGSILWRYIAESNTRIKKDILLHFFEGFIQFHVMILMSGYMNNQEFFDENKSTWITSQDIEYLKRASFGAWIEIGARLAKTARKEMSGDSNKRERLQNMFCLNRVDFLASITDKSIFSILREAKDIRNQEAHGGIESAKESTRKLTLLESELSKLRGIIGSCYDDIQLIRPDQKEKSLEYTEDHVFYQNVELLVGSRSPFRKKEIIIKNPLKNDNIYLYKEGHMEALQLVPLVKFMSTPDYEENACYFYNRIEKNGVHWKSYHFDREAERIVPDNSLSNLLNKFT